MSNPDFFRKYSEAVKFNKNIVIAGLAVFLTSTYVAKTSYESTGDLGDSAAALATEYSVHIPVFVPLFYIDNGSKYVDPATCKKDSKRVASDVKKIMASFAASEMIFAVTRFSLYYQFLQSGAEPYVASMGSSAVAGMVFFVAINPIGKATRLFRR